MIKTGRVTGRKTKKKREDRVPEIQGRVPKIGDRAYTFFSDREDGTSAVLEILPYTGKYKDIFNCVVRLSAPFYQSRKGYVDVAWPKKYYKIDRWDMVLVYFTLFDNYCFI